MQLKHNFEKVKIWLDFGFMNIFGRMKYYIFPFFSS